MLNCKPISDVRIRIEQSRYIVSSLADPHKLHMVDKQKTCSCGEPNCWAIMAVAEYLVQGGQRAPISLPVCPVCGAATVPEKTWDGKYTHEPGWRCIEGGLAHFLQVKMERIRQNWQQNPWVIPPSDEYPGVRREDLLTWQDCR